jgi:hypothetical protein
MSFLPLGELFMKCRPEDSRSIFVALQLDVKSYLMLLINTYNIIKTDLSNKKS